MLTLRQKIAQLFIVGFNGSTLSKSTDIYRCIENNGIGGVLLFSKSADGKASPKNLITKNQIQHLNHEIRLLCHKTIGIEPLISLDYEGGSVDRLADIEGVKPSLSARQMAQLAEEKLDTILHDMAALLRELGFNLNFAPVVDLELVLDKGVIGPLHRSFGSDSKFVTHMAERFCEIFNQYRIGTCFKHFPGHGSAIDDTHFGFVDVTEHYLPSELFPYRQLKNMADKPITVMTAHVINRHLEPEEIPASFSYNILNNVLRNELSYGGVIISDDLQMKAISEYYSIQESMILAINAGCDMLIVANQLGYYAPEDLIDMLEEAVSNGQLSEIRIESSFQRIQHLKSQLT